MTIWGITLSLTLSTIIAAFGYLWLNAEPIIAWGMWTIALSIAALTIHEWILDIRRHQRAGAITRRR